tara:strand:+ start:28 stop:195 length:168 start_codon:yes stop_codon:yes gene_type:complete
MGAHSFSDNVFRLKNTTNNSIDDTTGDWEFVEGAENLYLINRLNNKKYKINLTEV